MINPYITFEVSNRKDEVIAAMKNIGWADYWKHQGNHYDLPECCLWKDVSKIAHKDEAVVVFAGFIAELKGVIKQINTETASPDNGYICPIKTDK